MAKFLLDASAARFVEENGDDDHEEDEEKKKQADTFSNVVMNSSAIRSTVRPSLNQTIFAASSG